MYKYLKRDLVWLHLKFRPLNDTCNTMRSTRFQQGCIKSKSKFIISLVDIELNEKRSQWSDRRREYIGIVIYIMVAFAPLCVCVYACVSPSSSHASCRTRLIFSGTICIRGQFLSISYDLKSKIKLYKRT